MPAQYPGNSITKAARAKAGGGFESDIEVSSETTFTGSGLSITSTFDQGSSATIEAASDVLGARINAAPWVYMEGDRLWVRGTEEVTLESSVNQGESLFGYSEGAGTRNVSVFDNARGTAERATASLRSNFCYKSDPESEGGSGKISAIRALMPSDLEVYPAKTTNKFVFSCRVAMSGGVAFVRAIPYTSLTGEFGVSVDGLPGEQITLTESDGMTTHAGKIIAVDTVGGIVVFTSSTFLFSGNVEGGTITGDVSGASASLDITGYSNYSSGKYWRLETQSGVNPPEPIGALQDTANYTSGTILETDQGRLGTTEYPETYSIGSDRVKRYEWDQTGFSTLCSEIPFSDGQAKVVHFRGGESWSYGEIPITLASLENGVQLNHWANDYAGGTGKHHFMKMELEYVDDEIPRVVLGSASEIELCEDVGTCMSTAWNNSTGDATVRLNYGTIPSGSPVYLFVRNDSGWINPTSGVPIGNAP